MLLRNVIRKYSRVARNIPRAVTAAHRQSFHDWQSRFQDIAIEALVPHIENESDREKIEKFVETFTARNSGTVMRFCLSRPAGTDPGEITDADVEEWVRAGVVGVDDNTEGKVFDGRDTDVEAVIRKMQGILIYASGERLKAPQQAARDKYLPYIREFIANGGISDRKIDLWSSVVLAAWVQHVRSTWPTIMRRNLRQLLED